MIQLKVLHFLLLSILQLRRSLLFLVWARPIRLSLLPFISEFFNKSIPPARHRLPAFSIPLRSAWSPPAIIPTTRSRDTKCRWAFRGINYTPNHLYLHQYKITAFTPFSSLCCGGLPVFNPGNSFFHRWNCLSLFIFSEYQALPSWSILWYFDSCSVMRIILLFVFFLMKSSNFF